MSDKLQETRMFPISVDGKVNIREIMRLVCQALEEKGYRPIDQIVGYLITGDPAYITSHKDARTLLRRIDRDELLEEIVRHYLDSLK